MRRDDTCRDLRMLYLNQRDKLITGRHWKKEKIFKRMIKSHVWTTKNHIFKGSSKNDHVILILNLMIKKEMTQFLTYISAKIIFEKQIS